MGQRHNRRRTRPRSRNRTRALDDSLSDDLHVSGVELSPAASPTLASVYAMLQSVAFEPTAPTWHIGLDKWQIAKHTPRSETAGMEADQYRLFGGVPGDDSTLCYNMLEYFDRLDYINT